MASDILDRVAMVITTTGTGAVVANTLISPRFNTPAEAGAVNGQSYWWMLEEDNDYQIFEGVWTASGTSVARNVTWHSKIGNVHGTSNMSLNGNATLRSITPAEAFNYILRMDKVQSFSATEKALGRGNIYAAPFDAMAAINKAVNPKVEVSQELGTTGATLVTAQLKYIADCWSARYTNAAAVVTAAQVAASSFPAALPGFSYGLQMKATTALSSLANGDIAAVRSPIEGFRVVDLAWGTASASPLAYAVQIYSTASGVGFLRFANSNASRSYAREVTVAAGWNFFSGFVPGDQSGTWATDSSAGLLFDFVAAGKQASPATPDTWVAGSTSQTTNSTNLLSSNNNLVIVTGLWLGAGTQSPTQADLPRAMRPFDQELQMAKRYFQWLRRAPAKAPSATSLEIYPTFEPEMRASPTIALINGNNCIAKPGEGAASVTSITSGGAGSKSAQLVVVTSGLTGLGSYFLNSETAFSADARL